MNAEQLDSLATGMSADLAQRRGEELNGPPCVEQIMEWMDECGCEATDGCWVEPDGHCPHGNPSWALVLGFI